MMEFKDRFKELRQERKLTLKEVGEVLGYSEANMSLYESGKRQPGSAEDYIKIADYFNVSLDYLMGRDNNKDLYINDGRLSDLISKIDKIAFAIDLTPEAKELMNGIKEINQDQIRALNVIVKSMK